MVQHYEINPDQRGLALRVANKALRIANGISTARPGNVFIPNKGEDGMTDGTGTWIGAGEVGNGGVAPWIGDTTPPGKPSGISVDSAWGTVYVSWDGTLDGGVPADFAYVSVAIDGAVVGNMVEAGTLTASGYSDGQQVTVSFQAFDSARDMSGKLAPNGSEVVLVSVTVDDAKERVDADVEQAREDARQASREASQAKEAADAAAEKAGAAGEKADSLQGQVADVSSAVNGVKQEVDKFSTRISGAVEDASQALQATTELSQDLSGFKAEASQAYQAKGDYATSDDLDSAMAEEVLDRNSAITQSASEIKQDVSETYQIKGDYATSGELDSAIAQEVLNRNSAITQSASEIKQTVSEIYQVKGDYLTEGEAAKTYATQSSVTQTADEIKTEVSQTYATIATVDGLKNIADNAIESWTGTVAPTTSNKPASDWTTAELKKQHSGDLYYDTSTGYSYRYGSNDGVNYSWTLVKDTDITKALADAAAAQEAADEAQNGVNKINTDFPVTYATKSEVTQTADSIKSEVSKTYSTKTEVSAVEDKADAAQSAADAAQDDLDSYKNTVSTTYATKSSLTQTADSIKSEVSETYTTKTEFNALEVGGRNLLKNTAYENTSGVNVRGSYATISIDSNDKINGNNSLKIVTSAAAASGSKDIWQKAWGNFILGDPLRLTFWIKGSVSAKMWHRLAGAAASGNTTSGNESNATSVTTSWKKFTVNLGTVTGAGTVGACEIIYGFSVAGTFHIACMKLEIGTKATDWSPAPEDMLSNADAEATYATKKSVTTVEQTVDGLKSTVSSNYTTLNNKFSSYYTKTEVDQKGNSIKSTVSTAQTTADSALEKASTVEQTADGLEVRLTQAEKDVDTAQSTANTANSTANTAKTNASTALNRATYQYGTCATAAGTAAKVVTLANFSIFTGATIQVKFTYANTVANPTLNVNSTGAKTIHAYGANLTASSAYNWVAGSIVTFVYDGTYWNISDGSSLSKANSAQSTANTANSTANTAKTNAATAQSTADAAKTAAATAQSTANTAKTNAATAQSTANNAAKTATNYLKFDSSGLCVGNMAGTLQGNTLLDSTGMKVRNGTTVLSSFAASLIELGKNSTSSQIQMCGGKGVIRYSNSALRIEDTASAEGVILKGSTKNILRTGGGGIGVSMGSTFKDESANGQEAETISFGSAKSRILMFAQEVVVGDSDSLSSAKTLDMKSAVKSLSHPSYTGSKVVSGTGADYVYFLTSSEVQAITGMAFDAYSTVVTANNGDWSATNTRIQSVAYHNGSYVALFGSFLGSGAPIRINYTIAWSA